jgi:transcriptional regulator with XRE-family HTH domain
MSYLASAPTPRQLDIIADTLLSAPRETTVICQPAPKPKNHCDLSTASKSRNHSDLSTERGKRISSRRKQLGISTSALIAAAGIYPQTYFLAIRGSTNTRASTLDAIEAALDRLSAGETSTAKLSLCQAYLRSITVQLAVKTGWDPELMLTQDFSSENTEDPVWLQASRLRRCAVYLVVEGLRLGKADIGRAVGVSRQAIHKSVAAIEAERERDAAFDALMSGMMLMVAGERR